MAIPNIPITEVPTPSAVFDPTDTTNTYPLLEAIVGPPNADSVGPEASNRQARALDVRTETLRDVLNQLVQVANSLNSELLHRDGTDTVVDGVPTPTFMRGNLDMTDPAGPTAYRIVNMAEGTVDTDGARKSQLDTLETFLNSLQVDLTGALLTDGTRAMAAPLDMGANRIENVADPVNVNDAATKNYVDGQIAFINANFLPLDGSLPMTGDLNMGGNKVNNMNLDVPTQDGDGVSRSYLLQVLSDIAATPPGTVAAFAGDSVSLPGGWLICDGSTVSETTFANLFAVIGTTYNTGGEPGGDFRLPDLRGRVAMGMDNFGTSEGAANRVTDAQADVLGGTLGAEEVTLTLGQMPSHTHSYDDQYIQSDTGGAETGPDTANSTSTFTEELGRTTGSAGSGNAHPNVQPSMAMILMIKF